MRALARAAAALALLASGCSSDPVLVTPRSFDHAGTVAIVCFDTVAEQARPLADCAGEASEERSLHALVTQTSRGEVAAVDLHENRIIDSDRRIPGFTFLPVGELPSGIVVPRLSPAITYIADQGSMDVLAVATRSFRYPLRGDEPPTVRLALPAAPSDIALSPSEDALFVALPDAGVVARIPIDGTGFAGAAELLPLGMEVPPGLPAEPAASWCKACDAAGGGACEALRDPWPVDDAGAQVALPPREPVLGGPASPRPVALAVDLELGIVLVADAHLPVIHLIDAADPAAPLAPIAVGVPTLDVALTPSVPETLAASTAAARYLYAIDGTDRTVIVARYAAGPGGPTGAVLPVDVRPDRAVDRLDVGAGARVIEVLSPGFPGPDCALGTADATAASPSLLRGVFLAIGATDGTLHVVDVYDRDATCRGGELRPNDRPEATPPFECADPPDPAEREVYVVRHRPRIGVRVLEPFATVGTPAVMALGLTFAVEADGTTESELAPRLEALTEDCGAGMVEAYPREDGASPLVCVVADPWIGGAERWLMTYGGALPGAAGGRGRLFLAEAGVPALEGEVPFCRRGVLGAEDLGVEGPEAAYDGDHLAIVGALPRSLGDADRAACEALFAGAAGALEAPVIPILRARAQRLLLSATTTAGVPFERVRACFPELVAYEVRSGRAYTVVGTRSGFMHRVRVDPTAPEDGACVVDEEADPRRFGRALDGVTFDNGLLRVHVAGTQAATEPAVSLTISQSPSKLQLDVGVLPNGLLFSPTDDSLYSVDVSQRGLLQIPLSPYDTREIRTFQ